MSSFVELAQVLLDDSSAEAGNGAASSFVSPGDVPSQRYKPPENPITSGSVSCSSSDDGSDTDDEIDAGDTDDESDTDDEIDAGDTDVDGSGLRLTLGASAPMPVSSRNASTRSSGDTSSASTQRHVLALDGSLLDISVGLHGKGGEDPAPVHVEQRRRSVELRSMVGDVKKKPAPKCSFVCLITCGCFGRPKGDGFDTTNSKA